jgi:hypothetical protein
MLAAWNGGSDSDDTHVDVTVDSRLTGEGCGSAALGRLSVMPGASAARRPTTRDADCSGGGGQRSAEAAALPQVALTVDEAETIAGTPSTRSR